jgi:hypothetical protein
MHYSYEIAVLSTHTALAPLTYHCHLGAGHITGLKVGFRNGCDHLIRVKIFSEGQQIAPTNPDGYYALDGDTAEANLWHDLGSSGNDLIFLAWNIGTRLTHVLTFQVEVQGIDEPNVHASIKYLAESINNLVGLMRSWF